MGTGKKGEGRRKKEEGRRKKEDIRGDGCQLNVKCSTDLLFDDDCPDPLRVGGNRTILFPPPSKREWDGDRDWRLNEIYQGF
ncbi:hypothetical protein QUA20_27810 [Microcoleus sp. Pol7_A1]|uniref:hypothetical protein n=1 Tax=Microcoleus sp. Pol7_A1 TaxID=2818893 RepID=UPI002FCE97D3